MSQCPNRMGDGDGDGDGDGEGEKETLMDTMAAPSDSSHYISIPLAEFHPSAQLKPSVAKEHQSTTVPSVDEVANPIVDTSETLALGILSSSSLPPDHEKLTLSRRWRSHAIVNLILISVAAIVLLSVAVTATVLVRCRLARRAEVERILHIWAYKHRSAFHFQPDKNWMNDPNGPMYYQGYYHLFYQYNPNGAVWGNIVWGHTVSTDLVNWRHLENALQGDQWYDIKGIWSGSSTFLANGTPVLMYTGWSSDSSQVQNMAIPVDKTDPLLRKWTKVPNNPFALVPVGYNSSQFRDPTTAWKGADGVWRLLVGANTGDGGSIGTSLIYKSVDFQTWSFNQTLHSVPGTGMWECPDFYPVPLSGMLGAETSSNGPTVKHVLKISANNKNHDYYSVGTYVTEDDSFMPESANLDAGIGLRYDYGKFYASKSFFDQNKNRRVLFGWVNESDSQETDIRKGWASIMALPRSVWLDNRTTTDLIQWPVEELEGLRANNYSLENVVLKSGSNLKLDYIAGDQLDIEVSFSMPNLSQALQPPELLAENGQSVCNQRGAGADTIFGPFGVHVLATDDLREHTSIFFQVLQSPGGGLKILVCSDQSKSSVASNVDTEAFGSFVRVYETDQYLTLRILVDHSIVETFVQGGRTVITSRIYPELALDDAAQVYLFNNGTASITAHMVNIWKMNSIQITQFF